MNDLLTKFELLLKAGKLKEAKEMLGALVSRKLTPEEEAEAKILQTRLSIKLTNAIDAAYIDSLDTSIKQLKELKAKERTFTEKVNLAKTRAELVS